MSRIGKMPITVPAGVDVKIDGSTVTVKGAKGTLTREFPAAIAIEQEGASIKVSNPSGNPANAAYWGLSRSLLANMIYGCSESFKKELEVNGTGYRAQKQGKKLILTVGYSHPVEMEEKDGITIDVPSANKIIISGPDKQKVGQFAAEVREKRPPEPYKGKGIKYATETIRRKEGKAGKGK
ncbi:MAG: 50S ribosomal protein L6 [Oscillospiraceae bacterium]|jgi:large subunit ribosomal protein L6|nr:50S ribosomal protein L6 [Oscillospiraceae bacterium]